MKSNITVSWFAGSISVWKLDPDRLDKFLLIQPQILFEKNYRSACHDQAHSQIYLFLSNVSNIRIKHISVHPHCSTMQLVYLM